MSQESPRESTGGLAYEVTLAKAKCRPISPPSPREKNISLTHEDINKRMQEAEARRRESKQKQLEFSNTTQERMEMAKKRASADEEKFKKMTEEKLQKDLEEKEKNREAYMSGLVGRLKAHASRVQSIRMSNEKYINELQQRIQQKLINAEVARQNQLRALKEKLDQHMSKIEEARKSSEEESTKFSKETEQKLLEKMEQAIQNREDQMDAMLQKLKEHERHIEEVRANKQTGGGDE